MQESFETRSWSGEKIIDVRKLGGELEEVSRMNVRKRTVDRLYAALERFEEFIHEKHLNETCGRRSMGSSARRERCGIGAGGSLPILVLGVYQDKLGWSRADDTNPDDVREEMVQIASSLEAQKASRAQDREIERCKTWNRKEVAPARGTES